MKQEKVIKNIGELGKMYCRRYLSRRKLESGLNIWHLFLHSIIKVEEIEYEDPATLMGELIPRQEEVLEELKNLKALIRGGLWKDSMK